MTPAWQNDLRLIEAGFPCHQVGAETQRERDTGKAPPTHRLHVWWARRPLTPSRAAILASLLPADTDPQWFLRQLGIEKRVALINGMEWTLTGKILDKIETHNGQEWLVWDDALARLLEKENKRRQNNQDIIKRLKAHESFVNNGILDRLNAESQTIQEPWPQPGDKIDIVTITADPAHINDRIQFAKLETVKAIMGKPLKWTPEDLYGYSRAFLKTPKTVKKPKVILDPTSGGGSIPFEALRLGHHVIANELNPVASVILHATLDYPAQFGPSLTEKIKYWGDLLTDHVSQQMKDVTPFSDLPPKEIKSLHDHCKNCPELIDHFDVPEYDQTGLLYCRQVTCPNCQGDAPLLNTCWLSKESGKQWGVKLVPDGRRQNGGVRFETYRVHNGQGPGGANPNFATVKRAVGLCIHCKQAIDADEIKSQARGESPHGTWQDRLYCVVAVRFQPKLDRNGRPQRYKSGAQKGQIKTEKIRFFRSSNKPPLTPSPWRFSRPCKMKRCWVRFRPMK